ncbi:MAG: hypothetical protein RLY60_1263 [Pseudomonadota bacterium]
MNSLATEHTFLTAAFYKFVDLPDFAEMKPPLLAFCEAHGVKGMILLAREGINSTIAGARDDVHAVLAYLRSDPRLADLEHKESFADEPPFHRMKVRLKKEIVTMGVDGISPTRMAGTYVKPQDWNALIADPEVVLIDTRNDYEVEIGTFAGAINPNIQTFSQLPGWVEKAQALAAVNGRKPKVAMFCTGGIRCEKSTALMRTHGFDEVFHLQGGILKYLELIPPEQSQWQGECFVFDERTSVGHGLVPGKLGICRSCRDPLAEGMTESPLFELGVSCPRCHASTTEEHKQRARERQRQFLLARARGQSHLGEPQKQKKMASLLPAHAPVLYSFRRCPYAMRARLALLASGIRCEIREVALAQKPQSLLDVSPKATVPVLVWQGKVLEESLDIMLWALQQHDPQGWIPKDRLVFEEQLALIKQSDTEFKPQLDRYKYPNRFDLPDGLGARQAGAEFLNQLQLRLSAHGFLSGHSWGMADAAIAPFVRQFAHTDPVWFGAQAWTELIHWLQAFENSDAYQQCMHKYKVWHPGNKPVSFPAV